MNETVYTLKTDRNRFTRFWPITKLAPKMLSHFRPKTKSKTKVYT